MLRWIQKDKLLESISNDFEKRRRLYFAKRTLSPIFWSQRKCVCNAKAQQEHRFEWCQVHIARRWQCAISTYQSSPETKCFVALGSYAYFGNRYTHGFDYSEHIPVCFCSSSPTQPQRTTLQMLVMNVASLKILATWQSLRPTTFTANDSFVERNMKRSWHSLGSRIMAICCCRKFPYTLLFDGNKLEYLVCDFSPEDWISTFHQK